MFFLEIKHFSFPRSVFLNACTFFYSSIGKNGEASSVSVQKNKHKSVLFHHDIYSDGLFSGKLFLCVS